MQIILYWIILSGQRWNLDNISTYFSLTISICHTIRLLWHVVTLSSWLTIFLSVSIIFSPKKSLLRKFLMHNKGNTSIIMLSNNIQSFLKRNEDTSIKMDYLFTGLTKQTTSFRETIVNCALQLGKKFLEDISRRKLYSFWQFAQ